MRECNRTHVKKPSEQKYILNSVTSCEMQAHLGQRQAFSGIIQTNLYLNIILWSHECIKIIKVVLTVLWEERCEEACQTKRAKYKDLGDDIRSKGWSVCNEYSQYILTVGDSRFSHPEKQ